MEKHYCSSCAAHLIKAIKVCPKCGGKAFAQTPPKITLNATSVQIRNKQATAQQNRPPITHKYCEGCANYLISSIRICPKCRCETFSSTPPVIQPPKVQPPNHPFSSPLPSPASSSSSPGFWAGVAGFAALVEGVFNFVGYLIACAIVVGLLATNPSKQDFDQFLRKSIQKETGQQDFMGNFLTEALLIGAKEVTTRENYYFFSIYEIDISTLRLFMSDLPPRLKFVGVGGQFIPMDKLK